MSAAKLRDPARCTHRRTAVVVEELFEGLWCDAPIKVAAFVMCVDCGAEVEA